MGTDTGSGHVGRTKLAVEPYPASVFCFSRKGAMKVRFGLCRGRRPSRSWYNLPMQKLPRSFYDWNMILVVRELFGKFLVRVSDGAERIGRIVEVEAYLGPHDLAAHSARGLTQRTQVMF